MRIACLLLALAILPMARAESPPLQQWIDEAIQAGGGVVTVPEGVHVLSKPLVIARAKKLALRGLDKEGCVLKLASADIPAIIEISADSETLEIANLTLDGSTEAPSKDKTSAKSGHSLIRIMGAESAPDKSASVRDVTVRDCLLQNFSGHGVQVQNADAAVIERCSFRDGSGQAVSFQKGTRSGAARGNQIIRMDTAFYLSDASACTLEGNEVRDCPQAVTIVTNHPEPKTAPHILRNNGFGGGVMTVSPADGKPPVTENNDDLILSKNP